VQLAFIISESLRAEANPALLELSRLGVDLNVLTGDRHERALRLQQELSAEATVRVFGQLKPEEKVRVLNRIRRESGCTAMVGDGINDAPALAAADIGIALGCGTDISRDSAQVCLLSNDLRRIPWAISLARRTRTVVRQNLFWAFGYNSVGVVVAAAGWLNPAVAAGLMIASSLLVITNSMRLLGNAHPDTELATGSAPVSGAGLQSEQDHHIAIQKAADSTAFRTATVNTDRTDRMVAERTEASGCGVAS
jgi:cation transport ATPase